MNRAFPDQPPSHQPEPRATLFGVDLDLLDPELHQPLAALRQSLGQLGELLDADPQRAALFGEAMEHLKDVDRWADALADYACPKPLTAGECSVRELAQQAWGYLPAKVRDRVWLAPEESSLRLVTDTNLLAQRLACLLEEVAQSSKGEVLLHAHGGEGIAYFSIVESEPRTQLEAPLVAESLLARRDLERMGAEVAVRLTDPRHRCVVVRMPLSPEENA